MTELSVLYLSWGKTAPPRLAGIFFESIFEALSLPMLSNLTLSLMITRFPSNFRSPDESSSLGDASETVERVTPASTVTVPPTSIVRSPPPVSTSPVNVMLPPVTLLRTSTFAADAIAKLCPFVSSADTVMVSPAFSNATFNGPLGTSVVDSTNFFVDSSQY